MEVDISYRPSFALATVTLVAGETIQAEGGAMVAMSSDLEMKTEATGGFLKSLTRSVFGGESFFQNRYTAGQTGGSISVAPPLPGDIAVIEMAGEALLVQSGSYLASSEGIQVETIWEGAKSFFGGEGLIMLRVSGHGTLIISSYGAIHSLQLAADQNYVVDSGHLVSIDENMDYRVKKVAGWKSTLLSGEGLVIEITGPGVLTLQSRSQDSFLSWLVPKLPKQTYHSSSSS